MTDEIRYFPNGSSHEYWARDYCNAPCVKDANEDCPHVLNMVLGEPDPVLVRVTRSFLQVAGPNVGEYVEHEDWHCTEFEPKQ